MPRRRLISLVGLVVALTAFGGVVAWAATQSGGSNYLGMYYGRQMMGSRYVYQPAKASPVRTLAQARSEAQRFADRNGLRVEEVLRFERNFYAKLVDKKGDGATEVLVDPATGLVTLEYGPAMMWNTRYDMMSGQGARMMGSYGASMMSGSGSSGMMSGSGAAGVMGGSGSVGGSTTSMGSASLADAHAIAQRWLDANQRGAQVEQDGDSFPGYFTLETLKGAKIVGMISVNASTGAVWPHWWHGRFIAKSA
jgi:hypothetical protein